MRMVFTFVGVVVATTPLACFPSLNVDGAFIGCQDTADCPSDLVCDDGLCVAASIAGGADPLVIEAAVDTPVVGLDQTATVSIRTSEELGEPPVIFYRRNEQRINLANVTGSGDAWSATVVAGADDVSGPVALVAELVDTTGHTGASSLTLSLAFDLTPPRAVSTDVRVTANSVDNPLAPASPTTVRRGSSVVIEVAFDEDVVEPAALAFVLDNSRVEAAGVAAGDVLTFSFAADLLEALPDGVYGLELQTQDGRGNALDTELVDDVEVDNQPPAPPVFTRLLRAPWGSDQQAFTTQFEATADDAVMVLVLTVGITVDEGSVPLHIARPLPALDGTVSLRLPVDVPGLQLVAVDAAGNMSAPAQAERTVVTASILDETSPHQVLGRVLHNGTLLEEGDTSVASELRGGQATTSAAARWRPLTTVRQDPFPSPPVMAWDPIRNQLMAVADGFTFHVNGSQIVRDDVAQLATLRGAALALDPGRGRVVMFGGANLGSEPRNDVREWDGERWIERLANDPLATDRPRPRVGHAMIHVPALGGVVIVNGCADDSPGEFFGPCGGGGIQDVWLWDGERFTALCEGEAACGTFPLPYQPGLVVDEDGRLLALGSFADSPFGFPSDSPRVPVFDGSRWVGECANPCADGLPRFFGDSRPIATVASAIGGGGVAILDAEGGLSSYSAVAGFTRTVLASPIEGFVRERFRLLQSAAVVVDPAGDAWVALGPFGDVGQLWRIRGDRADRVVPSAATGRCAGALLANADGVRTLGGCDECDAVAGSCTTPVATREQLLFDGGVRAEADGPSGVILARGALLVAHVGDEAESLVAGVAAQRVPLGGIAPQLLIPDPRGGAKLLFAGQLGQFDSAYVDRIDTLDAAGAFSTFCAGGCDIPIRLGAAAAGGPDFTVVFGGLVTAETSFFSNGVFVAAAPGPAPLARSHASASFDDGRAGAWLFGGTTEPIFQVGGASFTCGGGGNPAECNDVWFFDGARWAEVAAVAPFGLPRGRDLTPMAGVAGGFVVAGGAFNVPPSGGFAVLNDAWRFEAPSDATPAQLMEVSIAALGRDGDAPLTSVAVHWCGEARDAAGDVVGAVVELWGGAGFLAPVALAAAGGCTDATFDAGLASAPRGSDRHLVALVRPLLTARTGVGAAFATLSTTSLEMTLELARVP